MTDAPLRSVRVFIAGRVQGIGFRYWTQLEAEKLGLSGWVRNLYDGRVEAVFQGAPTEVDAMLEACIRGPRLARVDAVDVEEVEPTTGEGFFVLPTSGSGA